MSVLLHKYTRRPFEVQAVQATKENLEEIAKEFGTGELSQDARAVGDPVYFVQLHLKGIRNPRFTKVYVGDWLVVRDRQGGRVRQIRVYMDEPFRAAFDSVGFESVPVGQMSLDLGDSWIDPGLQVVHDEVQLIKDAEVHDIVLGAFGPAAQITVWTPPEKVDVTEALQDVPNAKDLNWFEPRVIPDVPIPVQTPYEQPEANNA